MIQRNGEIESCEKQETEPYKLYFNNSGLGPNEKIGFKIIQIIKAAFLRVTGRYEKVQTPSILEFYDDRLVFIVPKRFISKNKCRKEVSVIYYKDVIECLWTPRTGEMDIYGAQIDTTHWTLGSNGKPVQPACYHKYDGGLITLHDRYCPGVLLRKEIPEHSPLKVHIDGQPKEPVVVKNDSFKYTPSKFGATWERKETKTEDKMEE